MSFQFPPYDIVYVFTLVACAAVAYVAWRRRSTPGGLTMVLLMLAVIEWALAAAIEAAAIGVPAKTLWSKVEYLGVVNSPALLLIFVLQYVRLDKWLTRRNLILLWVIPIITFLMAATNEWHHLVWSGFTPSPAGNNILEYHHGIWFWVHVAYVYACIFVSLLALIWAVVRSPDLYRQQAGTLLASTLAPIVTSVLYLLNLIPVPGLDPIPIAFGLTGLILAWGIFRFRLFDLAPVARDLLIENMSDGVLVLDEQNRVVDINPAARQLIGLAAASPIGQNVENVLAAWPDLVERYRHTQEAQTEIKVSAGQEAPRYLDLHIAPVRDRQGRFTGRLITLRDITERKQIENKLRQLSLAVEQSPASVVITDTSGNIEYVNPKFTHLTGYSLEEAVGQNPRILKSGDKTSQEYKQLWDTITAGGEWHGEFHNKKKNGELYWESAVISPITNAQGVIAHFLAVKEDITERKRAQDTERRWLQELEALRATLTDISGELELSRLLHAIVERVVALLEGEQGELALYDEAQGRLTSTVSFRQSPDDTGATLDLQGVMGQVAQTRQPQIVENYDGGEQPSPQYDEQTQTLTLLCAPLVSGGKRLGALAVGADKSRRQFTPQDTRLIEMFAQQAAIAIQNARLYAEAAQHAEQMVTLSRIGLATTSGLDMEHVLRTLLRQCQQVLPIDAFYVDTYDDETDLIYCPLFYDRGEYRSVASYRMHATPGLSGRVIMTRKTLYLPDLLDPETAHRYPFVPAGGDPSRSYVGVPLIAHDRVVGVISIQSYEPNAYTLEQIYMFETIATQAAIAIENSRLFEETQRRAERLALINEISIAINLSGELHAVLRTAADGLARVLNVSQVGIALFDDTRERLIITVDHPAPGNSSAVGVDLRIEGNLSIQRILSTRAPLAIEDAQNDSLLANVREIVARQRIHSILLVPLIARNQVIGTIGCDAIEAPRQFTPEEIELAQTIAALVALRIEQARLFEAERLARQQAQRRATDLSGLYAITRATSRSLATEDVLAQALSSALVSLGYEAGLIALAESGSSCDLRLMAERGLPAAFSQKLSTSSLANTLIARIHEQREIVLIPDLAQERSVAYSTKAAEMAAQGWLAFIGIPLIQREQSLGVLCLFSRQSRLAAAHDLALLASVGHQVATAVANAQLFQATLNERSRLKALIGSSRDGIILTALDGRIQIINTPALQILRLTGSPEEWIGASLSEALKRLYDYAPEGLDTPFIEIERYRTGDEPPAEGEVESPPHVIRWQSLPVKVGTKPMGRLTVLRDMTEERAVERMREDMTHMMVHDLRNPLGGISSSLELLTSGMMGELAPEHLELLEIAYHSTQRMIGLVNSILDVSRLESGRMPVKPHAFNVSELAAETLQAQAALANDRGIHLENKVPVTLPCAWADRGLIHRVLDNLIGNAGKFTPANGKVCVSASMDEQALPPMLSISVSDTGTGISPEIQNRLFRKFVTGGRHGSGSGLGLAFCKLAVEAHGGRIWAESIPGGGATFTFTLPISLEDK